MKKVKFSDIKINDGFWAPKQDMLKNSTLKAVYDRFVETHRFSATECKWKEGEPNVPDIFWDSDIAKWIEGAAYIIKEEKHPELEEIIDKTVDNIVKNSDEHGYFNSHFLVTEQDRRFCGRRSHELYCAGHLIEAAIAYYDATGKDKFLKAMCKYADYIEDVFVKKKSAKFITPGHPEIELALVRLYEATGEERYFKLAEFFIDEHGKHDEPREGLSILYNQDDMPLKDRTTADGHSVRAMYLFCGAADVARIREDNELGAMCKRVFDNAVNKRMYITGGIGSTYRGEAFTVDYDLPNRTAYAETCAAIALSMFASRMQMSEVNSKYADTVERAIYNGVLSGVSMDGTAFFYENPLEIDLRFNDVDRAAYDSRASYDKRRFPITERQKVISCSCCPPNIVRFIPSIAGFMYTYDDDTLYVHQYMDSEMSCEGMHITQSTDYPTSGSVKINCTAPGRKIALRIPGWCRSFTVNAEYELKNGYAYVDASDGIELNMDMPVAYMRANRHVHEDAGRIAVMRGPVVYCAEGVDNGEDLRNVRIDINDSCALEKSEFLLPKIKTTAYRDKESELLYMPADSEYEKSSLTLIPYYAFANRGETDMQVWFLKK